MSECTDDSAGIGMPAITCTSGMLMHPLSSTCAGSKASVKRSTKTKWKHTSMLKVRADRDGEFGDPGSVQDLMSAPVTKLMSRTELPDGPACNQAVT